MKCERIVFQGGIEIWRDTDDTWRRWDLSGDPVEADPDCLRKDLGLLPIQATFEYPWHKPKILSPHLDEASWLSILNGWVGSNDLPDHPVLHMYPDRALAEQLRRMSSMVFNSLYHMTNLVRLCTQYLEKTASDQKMLKSQGYTLLPGLMTGNWNDPFYEIEATITTIIRAFEFMRFTIWYLYGERKKQSLKNFQKTYPKCSRMPRPLFDLLDACWQDYLKKAKDYRDCLQHFTTLDAFGGRVFINEFPKNFISLAIPIPVNPETKSKKQFEFREGSEGLDYCWRLVNQLIDISRAIVADVEKPVPKVTNLTLTVV